MNTPLIVAHRTCPNDAPENSLRGIRVAAASGAGAVEIDVRASLDGKLFLMHDRTMLRTTGCPLPIEITPSAVVRRLRMVSGGERIPTVADAMDALPPEMVMAVDLKTPWAAGWLLKEIEKRGLMDRVLVWCQSAHAVRFIADRWPACATAYLKDTRTLAARDRLLSTAMAAGARAISARWEAVDMGFIMKAHKLGLRVFAWHRNCELGADKLTGLDGLVTDVPRFAISQLAGAANPYRDATSRPASPAISAQAIRGNRQPARRPVLSSPALPTDLERSVTRAE